MSSTSPPLKVLIIGGSRNIGYLTGLYLLKEGHTVTYLLRNPHTFDTDPNMQSYLQSGRASVVPGDSLIEDNLRHAWTEAGKAGANEGQVDLVLSTVGTTPKFALTRGIAMDIPDICTRSVRNLLSTMPSHLRRPGRQPRIIAVSGTGIGSAGLTALPLFPRVVSSLVLSEPRRDKLGMEIVLAHVSGKKDAWVSSSERVPEFILPEGWEENPGLPKKGEMPRIVLVRPAWLTDGEQTGVYRLIEGYGDQKYIARSDVAHFIGQGVVKHWKEYEGKAITIGY